MSFSLDDVSLSLRRYLSKCLVPADPARPWGIRLEREQVVDDERPVAVIESGRVATPTKRAALDQGWITSSVPLTVTCYPETTGTVRESGRRARQLKQRLEDLMTYGLDLGEAARFPGGPVRPRAGPDRIPLYDYAGVLLEGTDAERSLPPATEPTGWLRVNDSGALSVQDPEDARRWTVVLELRVSWERPGRMPQATIDAPIVQHVPGTGHGTP